jgi:hypothetical protein
MPIDDPISAIQALNESDDRQRSPVHRFAKPFLEVIGLFSPGSELTLRGISAVFDWLDQQARDKLSELVGVLADELKYRGTQIQQLIKESEQHRKFVAEDLPPLVLDALRRAEGVRAKDRIKRLARVLVRAAEIGGGQDRADYVEEMLRIATELSEREVVVLREIVEVQAPLIRKDLGRVTPHVAHDWMPQIIASLKGPGFLQGEIDSICAKLESFGLVTKTERNVNLISDNPTPYALLQKGVDFIDYIRSESQTSA